MTNILLTNNIIATTAARTGNHVHGPIASAILIAVLVIGCVALAVGFVKAAKK